MSLHRLFLPHNARSEFGLVAHALGGKDGAVYTNSREAFQQSCAAGFRLIEVDLALTADGGIVCFHDYAPPHLSLPGPVNTVTLRQFLAARYRDGCTPLDLAGLAELFTAETERYLLLDTKNENRNILPAVVREFSRQGTAALERVIPQIYSGEDLEFVAGLGRWPTLVFTCYLCDYDDDEVFELSLHTSVAMVAMDPERLNATLRQRLHAIPRGVYVHTINDAETARRLREDGVGVYTDHLRP